jgi:hypothetical protein
MNNSMRVVYSTLVLLWHPIVMMLLALHRNAMEPN